MRNSIKIFFILLVVIFSISCKKEVNNDVDFDVTTASKTYKLTDSIVFNITGNPDVISFYSGEAGHSYDNKDRVSRNDGNLKMSFQIRMDSLSGFTAVSSGNFKVLASTNFTAAYSTSADLVVAASLDSAMVNKATWVDISSRFTLPKTGTINTFYLSGEASLSDLIKVPTDPIYLAYQYKGNPTGNLGANGITIGSPVLFNTFSDGSTVNYNLVPGGTVSTTWKVLKSANALNFWATSTSQLKFTSPATALYSEDWAISNAFYPNIAVPDNAVGIKNISNNPISTYTYKFTKAGDYKVVFVASNNRPDNINVKIKEVNITVN
jgi:Domain of unknown function (DUF5017)